MRFIFHLFLLLFLFFSFLSANAGLNVELTVKECAGVGINQFPVTAVVPLPEGAFQNTNSFRITNSSGSTVPAQFTILNRRWYMDQSIANLLVRFQATVAPFSGSGSGIGSYFLKDDGSGNSTGTGLTVSDDGSIITVNTGVIRFTVKKSGCNIFDQVWLNGTLVVQADSTSGGELKHWKNVIQRDLERSDVLAEIEESGPMETVIRLEALTKYSNPSNHIHGWAMRIYAYAGKSFVKIDYQLQNSSKDKKLSYPLYFDCMNLNFNLKMTGTPNVRVGLDNGTFYKAGLGNGILLAQKKDSLFGVYGGSDTTATLRASGGRPDGVVDIDDGTFGVSAVSRFFFQKWPNGIQINDRNRIQFQLWPEWSNQAIAGPTPTFHPSGLYWIQDMQHIYKEVFLDFHATGKSDAEVQAFAKTVNYHPVVNCKTAWYASAKASLDLEGLMPITNKVSTSDLRIPVLPPKTNLGWNYFSIIDGRRTNCSNVGGDPIGTAHFFATENPADWFNSEMWAWGEMNLRPTWMAKYNFERDWPTLHLDVNICGEGVFPYLDPEMMGRHPNWRVQSCGGSEYDSALITETVSTGVNLWGQCDARMAAHAWFYNVEDAYFMSGNPWIKDWYQFIGELQKEAVINKRDFVGISRALGHKYAQILAATTVTGDTSVIKPMADFLCNEWIKMYRPNMSDNAIYLRYGRFVTQQIYMEGYLFRQVVNLMDMIKNKDPQSYATLFNMLAGIVHFNVKYAKWGSTRAPMVVSDLEWGYSGFTFADAQAWYYWHTGRKEAKDLIMDPKAAKGWGLMGFSNMETDVWNGGLFLRWTQFIRDSVRRDSIAPSSIADLSMTRTGTSCRLQWTAPADARHYHIVWSNHPIIDSLEIDDFDYRYRQWFSCNAVGNTLSARPGSQEQFTFTVPDTGLVFAALFSFDSADNMSRISNLAKSDMTPPNAPVVQVEISDAHNVRLFWTPSADAESNIFWYNVYKNGSLATITDEASFSETDLQESTEYSYEVSAVNGSLVEGPKTLIKAVLPADLSKPGLIAASAYSTTPPPQIYLNFSERLDKTSAEKTSNYAVSGGVSVLSAVLMGDGRSVLLSVDSLKAGDSYEVTVNQVKDVSAAGNAVSPDTKASFVFTTAFTYRAITPPITSFSTGRIYYKWSFLTPSASMFSDEVRLMDDIPQEFIGMPMLQTMNADESYCRQTGTSTAYVLEVNKESIIYVAYDDSQRVHNRMPDWLKNGWTDSGKNIDRFSIYSKKIPAGTVTLGGNNGDVKYYMYFVFLTPTDGSILFSEFNLALRKPVMAAPSTEYKTKGATFLTDGEKGINALTYGWHRGQVSSKSTTASFVEVDLEKDQIFSRVILYPVTDTITVDGKSTKFPVNFTITAIADNGTETLLAAESAYAAPDFGVGQVFDFPPLSARYVKVSITKEGISLDPSVTYTTYTSAFAELEIYDKSGLRLPPTEVEDEATSDFSEGMTVYPNPFNPAVTVVLQSLRRMNEAPSVLNVYDVTGREITRVAPISVREANRNYRFVYSWNGNGKASGVYLFKIQTGGKIWKKRAMLIR